MYAIILAAGMGTRLKSLFLDVPKPLIPLDNVPLLQRVLFRLKKAGIRKFVVVTGYQSERIERFLSRLPKKYHLEITVAKNINYHNGNFSSLAVGLDYVDDTTIVSMADHLHSVDTIKKLVKNKGNRLVVDSRLHLIRDLDEATKVRMDIKNFRIKRLGKHLTHFNAVDTGLFRFEKSFIRGMLDVVPIISSGSLSQALNLLLKHGYRLYGQPIVNAQWVDIDTPQDYYYALTLLNQQQKQVFSGKFGWE